MGTQESANIAANTTFTSITRRFARPSGSAKTGGKPRKPAWLSFEKIASDEFQFKKAPQAIDPENDVTLHEYFESFKETHLRNSVRPSTAESYVDNFKLHILPILGDLRLSQITPKKISEFIVGLMTKRGNGNNHRKDKPLSKSTIRLQIAYLRKVLNKALKEGRISSNPASRVGEEYKQARNLHEEINPLTEVEIESYLKAAKQEASQYYHFLLLALQTGMRSGELAALNWDEVNLDKKRIHVRRTLMKDGKLGPPKSKKSVRFVKINGLPCSGIAGLEGGAEAKIRFSSLCPLLTFRQSTDQH